MQPTAPLADIDEPADAPGAAPDATPQFEEGDIFGAVRKEKSRDPRGAVCQVREGPDGALFLTKDAIFCCSLENSVRKGLIWFITWKWFDRFIMSIILVNAVFMGLADYSVVDDSGNPFPTDFRDGGRTSPMNTIIEGLDPTFTGIYCVEMAIKIVALGFFIGPNTYLRDGWNVLDFVAVVTSVAALIPGIPNVSSLRTLRVLRPLRSLKMLPGMKVIIDSMLMAIEPLGNVVVLLIAVFIIFGILATQLFMGIQHQRCRLTPFPVLLEVSSWLWNTKKNPHFPPPPPPPPPSLPPSCLFPAPSLLFVSRPFPLLILFLIGANSLPSPPPTPPTPRTPFSFPSFFLFSFLPLSEFFLIYFCLCSPFLSPLTTDPCTPSPPPRTSPVATFPHTPLPPSSYRPMSTERHNSRPPQVTSQWSQPTHRPSNAWTPPTTTPKGGIKKPRLGMPTQTATDSAVFGRSTLMTRAFAPSAGSMAREATTTAP